MTEQVNKEAEQVSNEESNVEIVTKEPTPPPPVNPPKKKDPKKIEAGKKLAAYNKKAKNSKKELKENSTSVVVEETTNQGGSGFDITLTTVIAVIGLGLTGVDFYLRHKKYNQKGVEDYKMTTIVDKLPSVPVGKEVENEKNNKKGVKRVRFEPGME